MTHIAKITRELKDGRWGTEGQLPSFRTLAQYYNCSLAVVQQVIRNLDREGRLYAFQGKGTFWATGNIQSGIHRNRIVGVTYLSKCFNSELEILKEDWLRKRWFLSGYNADIHRQNPVREREFVMQAQQEHFSAMVILATPIAPNNAALFARMRKEGMKIAHLVPYRENMEQESYFCANYIAAGRLAAAQVARRGYKRIILFREGNSPDRDLNYLGLLEMAEVLGIEIEPDFDPERHWENAAAELYLDGTGAPPPYGLKRLLNLPEDCCLCSQSPSLLNLIRQLRENAAVVRRRIGYLCLDDFEVANLPISHIAYDRLKQLNAALDYATNNGINALDPVQQLFVPHYIDRGSL